MGPTWGPSRADRTHVGPMLTPWNLLSGYVWINFCVVSTWRSGQIVGNSAGERKHYLWNTNMSKWRHGNESVEELNTLGPRKDGRHFPNDVFKCIFLNEKVKISINISLKFVPKGPVNNISALVLMAWCRLGDKPLSEPMLPCSPTHICATRPQWVNCMPGQFGRSNPLRWV